MKTALLVIFFLASFFIRSLRWLGIVQQKEYRLDRLLLFIYSREGVKELFRLLPKKIDFTRSGLKRPKMTPRSLLVILIFLLLTILYFRFFVILAGEFLLNWYPYPVWYKAVLYMLILITYLFVIPLIVMASALPTVILAIIQTYKRLYQAKMILGKNNPKVIGITGSYGKTSTKLLLAHILEKRFSVFTTPKSYNTKYSVANSVVQGYTNEDIAIIEYAAYKQGEIKELTKWVQPNMALITGLTKQHVGLFGSLDAIISAKSELVASLPNKSLVICNIYDEATLKIYEVGSQLNRAKLIPVGPNYKAVRLENTRINDAGEFQCNWDGITIHTQLLGVQNKELVHLVIVTALELGLTKQEIIVSLESFVPDDKFMYMYRIEGDVRVIDDGDTSNPKGFSAVIQLAKSMRASRKILITPGIIDLGQDSKEIHLELAQQARKVFDQVIFVGDSGIDEFKQVFTEDLLNNKEQLKEIITHLGTDDLVVVEGRMPAWASQFLQ